MTDEPVQIQRRVKQVASRQISEEEAARLARTPPPAPTPPATPTAVAAGGPGGGSSAVDPTVYLQRHRRPSHHRRYRLVQLLTALAFGSGLVGLVLAASPEDHMLGQALGLGALAAGMVAVLLGGGTSLAYRVRGYAVAAVVVGAIALAVNTVAWRFAPEPQPLQPPPGVSPH